jgi:hypothetical protein
VVIGIVLLLIAGDIGWHVLGIGQVQPDYQVAYVGNGALPTDTVDALEQSLAALGQDCNGDGQVVVKVNQYVTKAASDDDSATYAAASTVKLMADLDSCDSYFFLLEDPEQFQKDYLILRRLDGELPSENDRDTDRYFLNWSDCPVLETLALGEYIQK